MTRYQPVLPRGRAALIVDLILVAWTAAWVCIGLAVHHEVRGLADLSDTVTKVGGAVEESGRAIDSFGDVPLVGDRLAEPSERIGEAGRSAQESGRSSRESVENLSVLLGVSIALIPSLPLVFLYVPWRIAVRRERSAIRAAIRGTPDPGLEEYLARRAAEHLSFERLRSVSPNPWHELSEGRCARLAAAELERLGLRREARALADGKEP